MATTKTRSPRTRRVFAAGEAVQLNNSGRRAIRTRLTIIYRMTLADADAMITRYAGTGTVIATAGEAVTVQFTLGAVTCTRADLTHVH